MKFKSLNRYTIEVLLSFIKSRCIRVNGFKIFLSLFICLGTGCDDFVDVDLPKDQLNSEIVFEDVSSATAVLKRVYAEMRSGGLAANLSFWMGLYVDELDQLNIQNSFYDHTILASNSQVSDWWRNAYNLIYEANAVIEGVERSNSLGLVDKNQLKGEALFIRAYLHSLLVDLYGDIPYISTTNFIANATVSRMSIDKVYSHIISDLIESSNLLGDDISGERVRPYKSVVEALLARIYLYTEQWEHAEEMASHVIGNYVLESDLSKVFLKHSSGTIWQFKPNSEGENTQDASWFIFNGSPRVSPFLREDFVLNAFETGDQRQSNWVGNTSDGTTTYYYAFKYKERNTSFTLNSENEEVLTSLEYPIIFRLAEQYLIRAEARARQGNISNAQADLNVIRRRAGLSNTTAITSSQLIEAIHQERRVELFTEYGHRWFDLKRLKKLEEVMAPIKPNWQKRNMLLPIPESEILINPNLLPQNNGY